MEQKIRINHILADGKEQKTIEGHLVTRQYAEAVYQIIEGRRKHENKSLSRKEKKQGLKNHTRHINHSESAVCDVY